MKYKLIAPMNKQLTPMEQVLTNRGIKLEDIPAFLDPSVNNVHDPFLLDNITEAIMKIKEHLEAGNKIFIQVDSDVDGYTSTAVLYNYIREAYPDKIDNVVWRVHEGKEHGIVNGTIPASAKLVIIPDAGSNQYEEHRLLQSVGIDVVVLDHHEADKVSEHAIVVNNQLCNYPNKALSGVGIVYKLCKAWDKLDGRDIADNYLDLVALGNIADMMDTRDLETRYYIQTGMSRIKNSFMQKLVEKAAYSLGGSLTSIGISFYVAPMINATVRVGTQQEKEIMFQAFINGDDEVPSTKRGHKGEMESLSEQAARHATNIKNRQKRMRDKAALAIGQIIEDENLNENKVLTIDVTKILDKNLTGLTANELMSKYKKPVLLLRDGGDYFAGSGRSYDKSDMRDFKDYLQGTGLFKYAEGHQSAFGAAIRKDNMDAFITKANEDLADMTFDAEFEVDFVIDANEVDQDFAGEIARLKPFWGKGVDESYIAITGLKVSKEKLTLMSRDKNPTLKITNNAVPYIKFRSGEEEFNDLYSEDGAVEIELVGKCNSNTWMGRTTYQIFIEDYNIVQKEEFYF